jgi:hypothetical protein
LPSHAASAASVIAGAVLRAEGSSNTGPLVMPSSRNWSSTMKRCVSLPTVIGAATSKPSLAKCSMRATACW